MNPLDKSLTITHQLIKPLKIIDIQKNREKTELLTNIYMLILLSQGILTPLP